MYPAFPLPDISGGVIVNFAQTGTRAASDLKAENRIRNNMSEGWKNVTDGNLEKAIVNYKECVVLNDVLSSPHHQMVRIYISLIRA